MAEGESSESKPPQTVVNITSFHPVKGKMVYTIEAKTTSPNFRAPQTKIERIIDDFEWLHSRLAENAANAGVIIPGVPSKVTFYDYSDEEMAKSSTTKEAIQKRNPFEQRSAKLERWLNRIARHPILHEDVNFRVFLEYGELKTKAAGFSLLSMFKFDDNGKSDMNVEFQKGRQFAGEYRKRIPAVVDASRKMCHSIEALGQYQSALANELKQEGDVSFRDIFNVGEESLRSLAKHDVQLSALTETQFYDLLEDHRDDIEATWAMHQRRLQLLAAVDSAIKATEKASATTSKTPNEKNVKALKEKQDAQDEAGKRLKESTEIATKELALAREHRFASFKQNIVKFTELQIQIARESASELAQILEKLKAIPSV